MAKHRVLNRRRAFLLGMGAFTVAGGRRHLLNNIQAIGDQKRDFAVVGHAPLRDRAAAKGLIYGAASPYDIQYDILSSDVKFATHFAQECAILVADGELKWENVHPSPGRFNFAPSDWLAKFARTHGMLFRGVPLVWHEALPSWFAGTVNSQNAKQILLEHIATVVKHYAGKIHSWDVVNEAILLSDGRSDGLRNSPWLQFLGPNYIEMAFRAAAEADSQALLVYNDNGLKYNTRDQEARRVAVLKLLEGLKSRGTPIHALGLQAHLRGEESRFNARKLKAFLHDVADLDLKIMITEMDVTDQKLPKDVNIRDHIVAAIYEDFLSIVLDEPAVIAVLTWGLSDRYTWLSKYYPRKDSAVVRSLPLDAQLRRKLAWNAMVRAFDKAPMRIYHKGQGTQI